MKYNELVCPWRPSTLVSDDGGRVMAFEDCYGMRCPYWGYVLIDKHAAPMEDVQQLSGELNHAAECVAGGYITWADIRQILKEYDVEVELT